MSKQYNPGDIVLGNWKLTRLIGEGSYGHVFEAEREDFGTIYKAAIKIITIPQSQAEIKSARAEGMDDESLTAYFRSFVEEIVREFALMSRLKGTANIVSYEDHTVIQHEGGVGWDIIIRMELLMPLLDHASEHPFTRQSVIKLGIDICRALELCQKSNIVHRDIKPENIFVSELGDYKLGDFGIARTVEKTMSGLSKKGTYTYMAPEVYREGTYGSSVDMYSLGIVLYRLLNENRAPFLPEYPAPVTHGDREAALAKRISGAKLPIPKNADGRLAEIVLKACAYDPKERYSSPMQMRQELEAIQYNKSEAPIIYPQGDEAPIKSVEYVSADAPRLEPSAREGTESIFGSVTVTEATESVFGKTAVEEKTESVLSGAIHTPADVEPPKASSKKKKFPLLAAIIPAGIVLVAVILVVTLSGGGAKKSPSGDEKVPETSAVLSNATNEQSSDTAHPVIQGISDNQTFDSIIWGTYVSEKMDHISDDDGLTNFLDTMRYEPRATAHQEDDEITVLPYYFIAGPQSSSSALKHNYEQIPGCNFIKCFMYSKAKGRVSGEFPYMIEGNKLLIAYEWEYDETTNTINTGTLVEIEFYFDGRDLILSRSGVQVKMIPLAFKDYFDNGQFIRGYVADNDQAYHGISSLAYWNKPEEYASINLADGTSAIDPVIEFNNDGTMNISWERKYDKWHDQVSDPVNLSCRYIWCGEDGLILIDDGQYYLYQTSWKDYMDARLSDSLDVPPDSLSDDQAEALIQTQSNVLNDLQTAFSDAGVDANIDSTTGKVTMDTSILFDYDNAALSDSGKAYLNGFLDVYSAVVLSDAYTSSISEILVEGHTDSDGAHDYNQTLSEKRAAAVAEYCLSRQQELAEIMVTKGCSYDNPIYDKNGAEDKAASRRVVFKFILSTSGIQ